MKGGTNETRSAPRIVLAILGGSLAVAADLPPARSTAIQPGAWDVAAGGIFMTDYNVRGISQSARRPSASTYFEPRYRIDPELQIYVGLSGEAIQFPNRSAVQVDLYGGFRRDIGKLNLDVGLWYYAYPGGRTFNGLAGDASCTTHNAAFCNTMKGNADFWEVYAKPGYAISDVLAVGANMYYSGSVLNSGAVGTYASATAKVTLPSSTLPKNIGVSVSGELGRYWFGITDSFYGVPAFPAGIKLPDYTTWNAGISLTYRVFTIDLRYYDTNLSRANCNVLTGDHTATFGGARAITRINPSGLLSTWCGSAIIAKLSFDTTFATGK